MRLFIKDIKNIINTTYLDIRSHFSEYFKVIIYVQLITLFFALPLISFLLQQSFNISGLEGLTEANFSQLFSSPLGIALLLFSIFVIVLIVFIELTLYIYILDCHQKNTIFSWKQFLRYMIKKSRNILVFQFLILFLYFIIIMPLGGLNFVSTITRNIRLPNFISGELLKSTLGTIIYSLAVLIIIYINIRLSFTLFFYMLNDESSIRKSMRSSIKYTSKLSLKIIMTIAVFFIMFTLIFAVAQILVFVPVILADKFAIKIAVYVAGVSLTAFMILTFALLGIAKITFSNAIKYIYLQATNQTVDLQYNKKVTQKSIPRTLKLALVVYIIFLLLANTRFLSNVIYETNTKIIAHRGGDTKVAVENTIEALVASEKFNPDYVELDVMETNDGELIIFHDTSLRRLANDNREIADLTLDELKNIELHVNGKIGRIPTLEEFITQAKRLNIKLLIEVKLHGKESDQMINNLVSMLQKHQVESDYIVQSFDMDILNQVKTMDKNIPVSFIIAINIGNLVSTDTEFVTIEDFSVRPHILNQARERNIGVFVWTINEKELMLNYMSQNIDGLITNELQMALDAKEQLKQTNTITGKLKISLNNLLN